MENNDVKVELLSLTGKDLDVVLSKYKYITQKKMEGSYFVSLGWIQAWLTELPRCCDVYMVVVSKLEEPVALFFLGLLTVTRGKLLRVHQLVLNATGHTKYDRIWIEYNSILSQLHDNDY